MISPGVGQVYPFLPLLEGFYEAIRAVRSSRPGGAGCHWQLACQCVCVHNRSGHGRTSRRWDPATPAAVMEPEIWVKVVEAQRGLALPPTGPSELSFLSVDTRTPYVVDYPGEDAGKTAHYMLRWVATTGEHRPRTQTASATIGA